MVSGGAGSGRDARDVCEKTRAGRGHASCVDTGLQEKSPCPFSFLSYQNGTFDFDLVGMKGSQCW